ncbi:hypothetical protein JEG42_06990, partial [Anoxybacillus sp. LAT_11]|nr:hypothetical protein [Anoxybacillus sp. LAT_11]
MRERYSRQIGDNGGGNAHEARNMARPVVLFAMAGCGCLAGGGERGEWENRSVGCGDGGSGERPPRAGGAIPSIGERSPWRGVSAD